MQKLLDSRARYDDGKAVATVAAASTDGRTRRKSPAQAPVHVVDDIPAEMPISSEEIEAVDNWLGNALRDLLACEESRASRSISRNITSASCQLFDRDSESVL